VRLKLLRKHPAKNKYVWEHSPFVLIFNMQRQGSFFEHGSETVSCGLKVSCGFFRITIPKKPPYRHVYGDGDKRGMLPVCF